MVCTSNSRSLSICALRLPEFPILDLTTEQGNQRLGDAPSDARLGLTGRRAQKQN
jgi:hypothetical protein